MRYDNLAYNEDYGYRRPEKSEVSRITNKRTSGGVMIKTGSKQSRIVNTQARRRAKANANHSTLISVVVLLVMAFTVLFRGLMLTSGYEKLEQKNALLSETIAENQKLQFKIDQTLDLNNIERIAQDEFNMGQPSKAQTVYINLDQTNEVTKTSGGNSVFDAIKNFFGGIVEYFA